MIFSAADSQLLQAKGVHLIGDFASKCGLSQSARDVAEVVQSMGIPVEILDLPLFPDRKLENDLLGKFPLDLPPPASPVTLLNLNADCVAGLALMLPRHFFENRYVIGIWYWETEVFPPQHQAGFDFVDEVWVTSHHIARILAKTSPVPVKQFTHLVHLPRPSGSESLPPVLQNDRFVFLFCFSFSSMGERKNPTGVCEAFVRAFPSPAPDGPLCVIKSNGAYPNHTLEFLDLRHQFHHRPDIIFMDGWLPQEQRDGLMNRAQCYVSLHRAEGLGLTLLESMSLGKPCIATAYSGNMDFTTDENSWLIPTRMVPVGPHHLPFEADQEWAAPDPNAAASAMLEAFHNPSLLAEKGRQSRHTVLTHHNIAAVARSMRLLLETAVVAPPRNKPGLHRKETSISYRARAYEVQKQLKAGQKTASERLKHLKGWNIAPKLHIEFNHILKLQKEQLKINSFILKELSALKQQVLGYDRNNFEHLLGDRDRISRLLDHLSNHKPDGQKPLLPSAL